MTTPKHLIHLINRLLFESETREIHFLTVCGIDTRLENETVIGQLSKKELVTCSQCKSNGS